MQLNSFAGRTYNDLDQVSASGFCSLQMIVKGDGQSSGEAAELLGTSGESISLSSFPVFKFLILDT